MAVDKANNPAAMLAEHPLEQQPQEQQTQKQQTQKQQPWAGEAAKTVAPAGAAAEIDDRILQELAKRRLMVKRSLLGQALDYLLLIVVSYCFINLYDWPDRMMLGFYLCAFWGIRLALRWFRFMRPSFREGIANYFRSRKEQQLEAEYERLKRMGQDYVAQEMNS